MSKKFEKYLNEEEDYSGEIEDAYNYVKNAKKVLNQVVKRMSREKSDVNSQNVRALKRTINDIDKLIDGFQDILL